MKFFAHMSENERLKWQERKDHLENTANISREHALKFDAGEFAYSCGLLHDIGKYSDDFQDKLQSESIYVDHFGAGNQKLW